MLEIQSKPKGGDWQFATRVSDMSNAWHVLAAYRADYPNEKHRLVTVDKSTGKITVIPDDKDELLACQEIREMEEDAAEANANDPLEKLEVSKLSDIVGKTIASAEIYGESGLEIRFTDGTLCILLPTNDEKLMFVSGDYVS